MIMIIVMNVSWLESLHHQVVLDLFLTPSTQKKISVHVMSPSKLNALSSKKMTRIDKMFSKGMPSYKTQILSTTGNQERNA